MSFVLTCFRGIATAVDVGALRGDAVGRSRGGGELNGVFSEVMMRLPGMMRSRCLRFEVCEGHGSGASEHIRVD